MLKLPLILDGATGSCLIERGLPAGVCPEKWISENPDVISALQREYEDAGSDLVLAPTFGAMAHKLSHFGLEVETEALNKKLFAISRAAVSDDVLVAADVSASGLFIAPYGDDTMETLVEKYSEQISHLTDADVIVSETNMTISDARAAVIAAKRLCDKPIFVTFTFDAEGRTMMGATAESALCIFRALGVSAFGLNCGTGPDGMVSVFEKLSPLSGGFPLIAKPNAGLPVIRDGKETYDMSPEKLASFVEKLHSLGVSIFGGCCGTGPQHIKAISEEVKKLPSSERSEISYTEYLATERTILAVRDVTLSDEIAVSDFLADDLMDCFDTCPLVRIKSDDDVRIFEENQHAAQNPVVFISEDTTLLERVLLSYNGRAGVVLSSPEQEKSAHFFGAYIMR